MINRNVLVIATKDAKTHLNQLTNIVSYGMVWYGILEFNVPLHTV